MEENQKPAATPKEAAQSSFIETQSVVSSPQNYSKSSTSTKVRIGAFVALVIFLFALVALVRTDQVTESIPNIVMLAVLLIAFVAGLVSIGLAVRSLIKNKFDSQTIVSATGRILLSLLVALPGLVVILTALTS